MFTRLKALYDRYETAHLEIEQSGRPILDSAGETLGYIDVLRLKGGRLQVQGWMQAVKLKLVHGGTSAEMAPVLRRPDVASALGLSETVGFDLSVPARISDIARSAPPGLVVTRELGQTQVDPISLPIKVGAMIRLRSRLAFFRDLLLALPAVTGWMISRDPSYRRRVKDRLRLGLVPVSGPLEPGLFSRHEDPRDSEIQPGRITIVLPVYNAYDLLGLCLDRIEKHTDLPWRLILVEDGSTDGRVLPFLRKWVRTRDNVVLIENSENRGFIASVNRGLEQALAEPSPDDGPVVLLNSDALVPECWASRLVRPFYRHEKVATVTPMSNDAEIFSVPQICTRTILTSGQGDAMDRIARTFAPEALLSIVPTGVGFCMAMGRDWLAREPRLDTIFGRGYGEEVDWCQKVARLGGRHLGLPGLFVEHRGGESFGSAQKIALVAQNNRIVSQRYPDYDRQVQDFIAADPLRTARLALGLAWAGSLDPEAAISVYLAHAIGGGADHWLEHRIKEDLERARPSVVLRVGGPRRFQLEVISAQGRCIGQTDDFITVQSLLAILPRRCVVYSCGVGDPDPVDLPRLLCSLLREDDSAEMLFHDFFPLSPSYTLLDHDGIYRGAVVPPREDRAHAARRLDGSPVTLEQWQTTWKCFAERAELVTFSEDSATHVSAVWPDLENRIKVRAHRLRHDIPRLPTPAPVAKPVLAVLGNIGAQKGAGLLQTLARRLDKDPDAVLRLVLIGNIDPSYVLPESVPIHGSYAVQDIPQLVERYGITQWLIPSVWPETFCYTVHEALSTGLPVLAFDLGAQGAAVRAAANGIAVPFDPEADLAQRVFETATSPSVLPIAKSHTS